MSVTCGIFAVEPIFFTQNTMQDTTGLGAPRTPLIVGGLIKTDGVPDGGCTGCLMSLRMAKALKIKALEESPTLHGMVDGSKVVAKWLARGIPITLNGVTINADAVVFDNPDYDFLIGRKAMHRLGVCTDWGKYYWCMVTPKGLQPLPVYYSTNRNPLLEPIKGETEANRPPVIPSMTRRHLPRKSYIWYCLLLMMRIAQKTSQVPRSPLKRTP